MFLNFELEMFLMVLLLLIVISMIPLIELKYNSDLYENIEKFNKYCLNNDVKLLSELDVKDTYMWNISSYIYDYNNLSNFFYKRNDRAASGAGGDGGDGDYIGLNRNAAKVSANNKYIDNVMKIYNYYLYMSLGFFIVLIVFFISQANILINIGATSDYAICMDGEGSSGAAPADIFNVFKNYMYALFVYVALFIIFFSLILKKLTELYADTDTYEYIMLMKELDILLKENKPANAGIIKILKKYSKNKINDIAYIALNNKAIISELATKTAGAYKDKSGGSVVKYENNENYKITLKNIEKLEYYNGKEAKDKVKNKVSEIFQFIYVYIIFLIVPIYMLSISLQGNYMYLLFTIIAVIIFSVSAYNIYNTLQN
jgi:hypothetical protein